MSFFEIILYVYYLKKLIMNWIFFFLCASLQLKRGQIIDTDECLQVYYCHWSLYQPQTDKNNEPKSDCGLVVDSDVQIFKSRNSLQSKIWFLFEVFEQTN